VLFLFTGVDMIEMLEDTKAKNENGECSQRLEKKP